MRKLLILIALPILFLISCNDDDDDAAVQLKKDIALIQDYLADSNLTAQSTDSGLHYIIDEQGSGVRPTYSSIITVVYTGRLLNGEVFDSGEITIQLFKLIEGWQEGMQLFNEGGKGKLLIPSALGYGSESQGSIPANSVLIFDIHLKTVID
ncbi:MAG: FKBP-type peptidyl-prolyl cis-trans isomerase [Bacteroidales bacterium]